MSEQNYTLPRLLNANQVMQEYGLSRPMTYRLMNTPAAGAVRIGPRRVYLQRDVLEKWIQQHAAQENGKGVE